MVRSRQANYTDQLVLDVDSERTRILYSEVEFAHASRAIEEALRGTTNTRVGAVIAQGDKLLATGYKGERVGKHAEQVALAKAEESHIEVKGAELYTTLEPCANSRTGRISCAELISQAGLNVVHIGIYDPNPRIYRLGWKHLRDSGVLLRDFPADLRSQARDVAVDFTNVFTKGFGMNAGAKFDFTQNGGRFTISVDEDSDSPSWDTTWTNCGARAIYLYGGRPGIVALARYARKFSEIDDPDALDFGNTSERIEVGSIGVMRNEHGHVLCRVVALEPTIDYGGTGHVSVTIEWEIRIRNGQIGLRVSTPSSSEKTEGHSSTT